MNKEHVWQELLQILTEEVGSRAVETWFKVISFSQWDSATKTVHLTAPNVFVRDWVARQYSDILKTHLSRLLSTQVSILFAQVTAPQSSPVPKKVKPVTSTQVSPAQKRYGTNPRYAFDDLIVGDHNSVAVAAAQAVAQRPGELYNPFFIAGGSGMGKTHLMQAIGNSIKKSAPKARVLYQSADRFVHEFVNAVRFGKIKQFEERYRETDVLLIDDVQLLACKEQTQEALFHIFTTLYEKGKQLIFSADAMPDHIDGLSDRLRSRLNGALITDLQAPSLASKMAIVHNKARLQKAAISDDVAHAIASRGSSNIRELEGLLIRVLAFATLTHQGLTVDLTHRVLNRSALEVQKMAPRDMPGVATVVAKEFNTTITELRSHKRQKNLVTARQVAMYCMKEHTEHSLRDIASYWCRKDHTTVIHAVAKLLNQRVVDDFLDQKIQRIEQELGVARNKG